MQWQEHQYTQSVLSAVEGFVSKDNLTSPQWQAAVRAITRHRQSANQTGSSTRVPGGLHPMYVGLQETAPDTQDRKGLLENTMADIVDALTVLDRIDGGNQLTPTLPRTSSREAKTLSMQEQLVHLIQAFGDQIALPHLHRFTGHYETEGNPGIKPPGSSKSLRAIGPPYLPPFSKSRNGYLRVRCRPSGTTPTHAEISKILTTASPLDPFAQQWSLDPTISVRALWTNNGTTWTNNGTTQPGSISTALSVKHPFTGIN
ncbi:hypothetical protein F5887DRAFT_1071699 [Amanita rubescens]|nr:hypothetical protein F5887DRAFT_1071699 [Amanita rubescens]